VNREAAVFLGAGRAALLQLAHPWVAASLIQHSSLLSDALGRFHSTFRVVYTMIFGSRDQAMAASRGLYRRHSTIRGQLTATTGAYRKGDHHEANAVEALRWVFATLVDSAVLAYEFALPPLTANEREAYYRECKWMGLLFGIPTAALPDDWPAFSKYMEETLASSLLAVGEEGRLLGRSVLAGAGTWVRPPFWYRALTAQGLPAELRTGFDLPYGTEEDVSVAQARRLLRKVYPQLPGMLRFVGPYHEANARLCNRAPNAMTRLSNRFWMGQPRLLHPGKFDTADETH